MIYIVTFLVPVSKDEQGETLYRCCDSRNNLYTTSMHMDWPPLIGDNFEYITSNEVYLKGTVVKREDHQHFKRPGDPHFAEETGEIYLVVHVNFEKENYSETVSPKS
jgi:hypothetical protein